MTNKSIESSDICTQHASEISKLMKVFITLKYLSRHFTRFYWKRSMKRKRKTFHNNNTALRLSPSCNLLTCQDCGLAALDTYSCIHRNIRPFIDDKYSKQKPIISLLQLVGKRWKKYLEQE